MKGKAYQYRSTLDVSGNKLLPCFGAHVSLLGHFLSGLNIPEIGG